MFDHLIESTSNRQRRGGNRTFFISFLVHALAIGIFVVIPLYFYAELDEGELLTFLAAPPPPPPPPTATTTGQ